MPDSLSTLSTRPLEKNGIWCKQLFYISFSSKQLSNIFVDNVFNCENICFYVEQQYFLPDIEPRQQLYNTETWIFSTIPLKTKDI